MGRATAFLPACTFLDDTALKQIARHHAHGSRRYAAIVGKLDPRGRTLAPDISQKRTLCCANACQPALPSLSQSFTLPRFT
jgi:hypothetical protein